MNDNQIIEAVDHFIDHRLYNYALMINGSWGCGKTYFIEKRLIPHLQGGRNYDVNYISLYGIKEPDQIGDILCTQAIKDKITKKTGIQSSGKGGQITTLILGKVLKYGLDKTAFDSGDIKDLQDIIVNYDNNIIIFDDLERCSCDICSVLGYINNLVEHSNASVIIVANEKEIGNWTFDENVELKMLVALNERLVFELPPQNIEEIVRQRNGNNRITEFTPDQLQRARRMLFVGNEEYKRSKEKIIGLTIEYEPDIESVFRQLILEHTDIEKNKDSSIRLLQERLLGLTDQLIAMAKREHHLNIRSFLFFLEKIVRIYRIMNESNYPVLNDVARYCYRSTISCMKGETRPVWEQDYGVQTFGMGIAQEDRLLGFSFIDELITGNSFDEENASEIMSEYVTIQIARGQLVGDPYQLIRDWYGKQDEEIELWLKQINENILIGKYTTAIFPNIIHSIVKLQAENLFCDLGNLIIDSMKKFIKDCPKEKLEAFDREQFIVGEKNTNKYQTLCREIADCMDSESIDSHEKFWNSLLDEEDWAQYLSSYVGDNKRGRYTFVYWIAPEKLFKKIKCSKNSQIEIFRDALHNTYRDGLYYDNRKDDLPHLHELYRLLENTDGMGKVQKVMVFYVRNDIARKINEFDPEGKDNPVVVES